MPQMQHQDMQQQQQALPAAPDVMEKLAVDLTTAAAVPPSEDTGRSWSEIISEMGDRTRKEHEARIAAMRGGLSVQKEKMTTMGNEALFDYTVAAHGRTSVFWKDEQEIWQEVYDFGRRLLLARFA